MYNAKAVKPDLLIVKNSAPVGPGLIERVLAEHDITYDTVDVSQGQALPPFADYRAVIVLGGPVSANDPKLTAELAQIKSAVDRGIPFLGVCLGLQLLVKAAGGRVVPAARAEAGFFDASGRPFVVQPTLEGLADPLFAGLSDSMQVLQSHADTVELGPNMQLLATSQNCPNQVVKVGVNAYGIQSHFELTEPMLHAWAEELPLLQPIGAEKLLDTFARQRATYTIAGLALFRNFLGIAGFV